MLVHMLKNHNKYFPNTKFDMDHWTRGGTKENACGTAACAVGSAMYWKPFRLMGLHPNMSGPRPQYRDDYGYSAARAFFGLNPGTSMFLFDPFYYEKPTPRDVVKRIQFVLRTRDVLPDSASMVLDGYIRHSNKTRA